MSFERFSGADIGWDSQPAQPAPSFPCGADPRAEEVHSALDWLEQSHRPDDLSETRWYVLLRDLRHVADQWLDIAFGCGWSIIDLFGSSTLGKGRLDLAGVAILLNGRPIESIDENRIVISNRLGAPNVFYRHSPGCSAPFNRTGAVPIWEAIAAVRP